MQDVPLVRIFLDVHNTIISALAFAKLQLQRKNGSCGLLRWFVHSLGWCGILANRWAIYSQNISGVPS